MMGETRAAHEFTGSLFALKGGVFFRQRHILLLPLLLINVNFVSNSTFDHDAVTYRREMNRGAHLSMEKVTLDLKTGSEKNHNSINADFVKMV